MTVSKPQVLDELRRIKGPDLEGNIVDLGLVSEILVKDDRVYFSITVPAARAEELEPLRQAAENVVQGSRRERRHRRADGRSRAGKSGRRVGAAARKRPRGASAGARPGTARAHDHSHALGIATAMRRRLQRRRSRVPAPSRWPRFPASRH